jgi:hypothetical protein
MIDKGHVRYLSTLLACLPENNPMTENNLAFENSSVI